MTIWETLPDVPRDDGGPGDRASALHHDWLYQPLIPRLPSIRSHHFTGDGTYPWEIFEELYVSVSLDALEDPKSLITDMGEMCSAEEWRQWFAPLLKGTIEIRSPDHTRTPLKSRRTPVRPLNDLSIMTKGRWIVEPVYRGERMAAVIVDGYVLLFKEKDNKRFRDSGIKEAIEDSGFEDRIIFGSKVGDMFIADEIVPLEEGNTLTTGEMRTELEDVLKITSRTDLVYAEDFDGQPSDLLGLIYQVKEAGHHGLLLRSDAGCFFFNP